MSKLLDVIMSRFKKNCFPPKYLFKFISTECEQLDLIKSLLGENDLIFRGDDRYNKINNWISFRQIIENKSIFIPHYKELNDPFECMANLDYNCDVNDVFVKQYLDDQSPEKRKEFLSLIESRAKRFYFSEESPPFGVYSLSEDPTIIQLWSHYGNNHKGLCVGFEIDWDYVKSQLDETKISPSSIEKEGFRFYITTSGETLNFALLKAKYVTDVVDISFDKFAKAHYDKYEKELFSWNYAEAKHENWKYEKEWRLVCFNWFGKNSENLLGIDRSNFIKPCGVMLGCQMLPEIKNIIREKYGKTYKVIDFVPHIDEKGQGAHYSLFPSKEMIFEAFDKK